MSTQPMRGNGGIEVNLTQSQQPEADRTNQAGVFPIPNDDFDKVKTISDLSLSHLKLDDFPVIKDWREKLFDPAHKPEICDELPRLLTEFYRQPENDRLPLYTRRAKALYHVFSHKTPLVRSSDLLPGQTTTSFVGPVVYVDTIGYCIWPELKTVGTRAQNAFTLKPEVAERLNKEIFPFWLERRPVQEVARYSDYDTDDYKNDGRDEITSLPGIDPPLKKRAGETPKAQELMERVAFYLSDKATCVSHTVPDFDRVLNYGLDGLIEQLQKDIDAGAAQNKQQKEFLQGVITVFEGAKIYAQHLADAAQQAGNQELARICRKVPAGPAETLHEALSTIWILYHLLLQENTNFGFSIGRLDQLLNRYYLSDWNKLQSEEEKNAYVKHAVELVSHFFLRCSDHVPLSTEGSETLFAGSGSNQALTLGGTHFVDGEIIDAVNDMTYITLKATEILSIRDPNVHARYHKNIHNRNKAGNPLPVGVMDPYMRRLCQVNILTRATPALHGDAAVVHSMAQYYADHSGVSQQEALQDAHDYSSIGCIEQNASGKHYGNTGSTLFVFPAVLELTMFGGKHRGDGIKPNDLNLLYNDKRYTSKPLTEMRSMDEFIQAFELQLDELARHAVQNNNYLGRAMEKVRPSPLLSGLFVGPTNLPGESGAKYRDVAAGGAKYNSAGVAIIGLADVIDSFCVIDALVFGGKMSAAELLAALDANYDAKNLPAAVETGDWSSLLRRLRRWFQPETKTTAQLTPQRLNEIKTAIRVAPKYGAGVAEPNNALAVKYTHLLTKMINDVFYKYRTHRGGRYLAGYWSMTNHAGFGMLTKATPNGRKSSESFASGITPCPGIVKGNGDPVVLLDHMLSVAEVNADTVKNGYTYNLSLTTRDRGHFSEDTELFSKYMKTFMDEDGVLVQMCVSSIDDLIAADKAATAASQQGAGEEAQKALEAYKDLMIRVAGYSAYYVTLSPEMRTEIIQRANFAMDSGKETHTLTAI